MKMGFEPTWVNLKSEISSECSLVPCDTNLPIMLSCDGSPVGVADVLWHNIDEQGTVHSICIRSWTAAEQNDSQTIEIL